MQTVLIRNFYNGLVDAVVRMTRTKTNYWAEFVIDLAVAVAFVSYGFISHQVRIVPGLSIFVLGLFMFTFIEYFFHRWLFHGRVKLLEQGHTAHHDDPMGYDSLPFFVPALVMLGFAGLLSLFMPLAYNLLLCSAMLFGYLSYVLSHFAMHHWRPVNRYGRRWAALHHIHHYHPDYNYGVTTPLWDIILGTRYVSQHKRI
jgi:sterol desaturase/sphingolipid hydroxylase (fatty acid hydroxylase superfamily)